MKNEANINKMPLEIARIHLPCIILKLLNGAEVSYNYQNKKDVVNVFFENEDEVLHVDDFANAKFIADNIYKTYIVAHKIETSYQTLGNSIKILKLAQQRIDTVYGRKFAGKRKVIFIKGDNSGCGYWRMVLPARFLDKSSYIIDVSCAVSVYDYLMEYDVIVVQRTMSWDSFYIIDKLKKNGKRIIYDIDDNLFALPHNHPVRKFIGLDETYAAAAIMSIADKITTTTELLKDALVVGIGEQFRQNVVVIPNAIDISSYQQKLLYPKDSTDKIFRIVWAGSATHEYDFNECVNGLDQFFLNHKENPDVKILFMGYLPVIIRKFMEEKPHWKNRVDFIKFNDIETYFKMISNLNADIAICPLAEDAFTICKSNIKFIEYTLAGIPVAASNIPPYSNSLTHDVNAILTDKDGWCSVFEDKYADRVGEKWKLLVSNARKLVEECYDINKISCMWDNLLK